MPHTHRDQQKLLGRVRRIQGQMNAIAKHLEQHDDCAVVLQTIAACRGALNALIAEVIAGHIREHIIPDDVKATKEQVEAAEDVIDVINSYLR